MRVIAGTYGGRTLRTVKDLSVRPTTDRAKQVIFDLLSTRVDLTDARILDLFAGSGSLGLEALSRGAASVTFVEQAVASLDVLWMNIRALKVERQSEVIRSDVFRFLKGNARAYDVVFCDPPYKLETITTLPQVVGASAALKRDGWFVMEHSTFTPFDPDPSMFAVVRKELGQTVVLILQKRT
ncbi:MAG: 16S rRNA (guanine(966)-N(2))-methyltransferase RsmD [Bacteroidetes bacterium]|jgi:16S rRNA (guanine966-N2)-methyltransferase|nr:16S rRNA (guanine(966)-N(2))-methyltransferase RsmD [Bacteroidota bacterium]